MKHLNFEILKSEIDTQMESDLADCRIAGASVFVCQTEKNADGTETERHFSACCGKKNTETGEDMKPGTLFRLASMTKPVTAAAILILVQKGVIGLYDRVSDYLPAFRDMVVGAERDGKVIPDHKLSREIEIYHLLTHTSGILAADFVGEHQPIPESERFDLEHIVNYYGNHILLSNDPLGKAWYSPFAAFDVAARIVEVTTGMVYADFLKKYLFDPLEMHDTTYTPSEEQWQRMAAMHNRVNEKNAVASMGSHTMGDFPLTYTCGGAGLAGTVEDYARFASMLLHEGTGNGKEILTPEMVRLMRTRWIPEGIPGIYPQETWGLGVRVVSEGQMLPCGSFGWSGAYGTHFWVDPENSIYAVYGKNSFFDGGSGAATSYFFERSVMRALE